MALNYSLRPLFPAHVSKDNLASPMRNRDGFSRQRPSSREVQDRGDNMDWENVLPADPFGMDIDMNISSTVTALLGSLEYGACGRSEVAVSKEDCLFFAEFNFLFSKAMEFHHPFLGNDKGVDKIFVADMVDARLCEELGHPFCNGGLNFVCTTDRIKSPQNGDMRMFSKKLQNSLDNEGVRSENPRKNDGILMADVIDEPLCAKFKNPFCDGEFEFAYTMDMNTANQKAIGVASVLDVEEPHPALSIFYPDEEEPHEVPLGVSDIDGGEPHEALGFALAYLSVCDLLSVERVCASMRDYANDALLWKNVHIDQPLNDRITDDILVQLTSRSQGSLQCLSLVECQRITDGGLKRVLESNLRLTKLSVPGCTRLTIDGIVSCLRAFKLVASPGIKCLRIGGLYGVTHEHFDELMSLMGIQNHTQANHNKPLFYHRGNFYLSCEDERPIDIETCPRCQKLRLVYDCPVENCQGKDHATQSCRACTLCIPRCVQCGKCIIDGDEYVENFCLEFLCSFCWKQSSRLHERQDTHPSLSVTHNG